MMSSPASRQEYDRELSVSGTEPLGIVRPGAFSPVELLPSHPCLVHLSLGPVEHGCGVWQGSAVCEGSGGGGVPVFLLRTHLHRTGGGEDPSAQR